MNIRRNHRLNRAVAEKQRLEGAPAPGAGEPKPRARSEAEETAVKQRNIQIALVATNVAVSTLIALKTFGII